MKRTQILIEPDDWSILLSIAKRNNSSIGGLIRYAIKKTFIENELDVQRIHAIDKILKTRQITKNINYKELISDGRNY